MWVRSQNNRVRACWRKMPKGKPKAKVPAKRSKSADPTFIELFTELLRAKKIRVPKGLAEAPPEAYASQPASFVSELERLPKRQLEAFAEKVASYAGRQKERALAEWERSPLVAEIRRRKLKEPPPPSRPTGASVSLGKPLKDWKDAELLAAAKRWSSLGR